MSSSSWSVNAVKCIPLKSVIPPTSTSPGIAALKLSHSKLISESSWTTLELAETEFLDPFNKQGLHKHCHNIMDTICSIRKDWLLRDTSPPIKIDPRFNAKNERYNSEKRSFREMMNSDMRPSTAEENYFKMTMSLLQIAQDNLPSALAFFQWSDRSRIPLEGWPAPDVSWPLPSPQGNQADEYCKSGSHSLVAIITSLSRLYFPSDNTGSGHSELTVERHVGSCIAAAFCGDKVKVRGGQSIMESQENLKCLTISKSFPHPDIFSESINTSIPMVLSVGEAKKKGIDKFINQARSQMISAIHPTMNIMLAYYLQMAGIQLKGDAPVDLNDEATWKLVEKTKMPPWLFAYGVYYDDTKVTIYAHYPVIEENIPARKEPLRQQVLRSATTPRDAPAPSKPEKTWALHQAHLVSYPIGILDDMQFDLQHGAMRYEDAKILRVRFRLAIALAVTRRHGEMVRKEMEAFLNKFKKDVSFTAPKVPGQPDEVSLNSDSDE